MLFGRGFSPLTNLDYAGLNQQIDQRSLTSRVSDWSKRALNILFSLDRVDKSVELVESGIDLAIYSLDKNHPAQRGLQGAYDAAYQTRRVISLTKGPVYLAVSVYQVRTIGALITGLRGSAAAVPLNGTAFASGQLEDGQLNPKYYLSYAWRAEGVAEQALALVRHFLALIGNLACTVAYGICRPIQFTESYVDTVSEHASRVGQQFGIMLFVYRITAVFKNILDFVWESLTFSRTYDKSEATLKSLRAISEQAALVQTMQKMELFHVRNQLANSVSSIKICADLVRDVSLFTPLPIPVMIAARVIAAVTDFFRMWLYTMQ